MKKAFKFLCMLLLAAGIWSCEKEATNPGDFNLKATLDVTRVYTRSGQELTPAVMREIDTTYVRFYTVEDEETGDEDTIWYKGDITARFVELEPISLEPAADTIYIDLVSNAKWSAPMPASGGKAQWFFTTRMAGGGDGTVEANVTRNRNKRRSVNAEQYILTSDSTVMYKLTFSQAGERD